MYQISLFNASSDKIFFILLNLICDCFPAYNWNGFERVYAIVGLQYKEYVVVDRFCEVPNSSDVPSDTFTVTAKDLIVIATGLSSAESIIGFAHTHPPAQCLPSDDDIAGITDNLFGLVLCENKRVWYNQNGEILFNYLS